MSNGSTSTTFKFLRASASFHAAVWFGLKLVAFIAIGPFLLEEFRETCFKEFKGVKTGTCSSLFQGHATDIKAVEEVSRTKPYHYRCDKLMLHYYLNVLFRSSPGLLQCAFGHNLSGQTEISEHTGLYTVQQTSKLQMLLTRPGWKTIIKSWRKINQPLRKEDRHYSTYYFNCLVWSELCHCCQLNLLQLATYNWKDTLSVILSFSYMQTWTSKEHTKEDPIA